MFAPAKMNWASTRMYNTLKRAILYVLYGLIMGVCGLLDTPWGKLCVHACHYVEICCAKLCCLFYHSVKLQATSSLVVQNVLKTTSMRETHSCSTLCLYLILQLIPHHTRLSFWRSAMLLRVMRCVHLTYFVFQFLLINFVLYRLKVRSFH